MTDAAVPEEHNGGLAPKQQSLLRSSLVMASGTLLSRLLGFVRNALLIAAIGVSLGAADAFGAANTLPNSVYNLLAAGVFDAILIPQIVRALKQRGGTVYVNRLLTAAGTILFIITVLAMVGAPLLITITSSGFPPQVRALAITFALWCLPQIFFYGLYNLLGEVLNARGIFGPYMWAPVINNVISIAGLVAFIYIWGPSGEVFPADEFNTNQLYVLAGSATLGVILQALVLLIPLRNSGVKLRPDFKFRETNFGSASKVAGWTFATLLVSQLGVLSTTNLAARAVGWADEQGQIVASLPAYNTAFMIYMVPQALIALTLATAIFTRLANNVADSDYVAVARNYTLGVRIIVLLSMLAVAIIMVGAVPMMQIIMPTFHAEQASLYAWVVVALMLGVPSTGIVMISQRVFFAFENARPVFLMGIIPTALQLIIGWTIFFTTSGEWWTVGAALAETICRVLQGFIAIFFTAYFVRTVNAGKLVAYYVRYLVAFAISGAVGWGVLHFLGPGSYSPSMSGRLLQATGKLLVVTVVITVVYFLVLHFVDRAGTDMLRRYIGERLPESKRPAFLRVDTPEDGEQAVEQEEASSSQGEEDTLTTQLPLGAALSAGGFAAGGAATSLTAPTWEEIINGDFASRSVTRSLSGLQEVSTGQMPMTMDLSEDTHSTDTPEGIGLSEESTETEDTDAEDNHESGDVPAGEAITTPVGGDSLDFDALLLGPDENGFIGDSAPEPGPKETTHFARTGDIPVVPPQEEVPFLFEEATTVEDSGGGGKDEGSLPWYKFNPTGPALIFAALIVVGGIIFANSQLRKPVEFHLVDDIPISGAQSGEQSGAQSEDLEEAPEEVQEAAPAEPELPAPAIASIWISSWNDDGMDHPELVDALTDGNPDSLWYTRYYDVNQFREEQMISLLVNLEQETLVSEIILDVKGSGGEVLIREPEGDNPRVGPVLASSPMDGVTTIKLPQPTKMSKIAINFLTLPTDFEGLNRAQIADLSIK